MSAKGITDADKHADAKTYYADIFNSPHWEPSSRKPSGQLSHPRMDITKRAAMFASFDALTGYREAVAETARYSANINDFPNTDRPGRDPSL